MSSIGAIRRLAPTLPTQVGLDDPGVLLHVGWFPFGDLLAIIEDRHPIGHLHHHAHVVLDQQDGQLVFLDEPTAALGVVQTKNVLDTIKRVRDKGIAVVLISHSMPEVLEVADRIQVMRLGTRVVTLPSEGTTVEQLVGAMTGALDFSKEEIA